MLLAWPFLLGWLLDLLVGDPGHWPHPIRGIGRVCEYWETRLYQPRLAAGARYWLAVAGTSLALLLAALGIISLLPPWAGMAALAYLISTGLATRSLHQESARVEDALAKGNLPAARNLLARIVGRDTASLEASAIRRAVLETVAENLGDGVVAPMCYCLALGVPGLFLYKAANTMDSMVGYKNGRYLRFGRVAARADDVLNYLPARLTALLMVGLAGWLRLDRQNAWRILRRDAGQAASPNAGWPEAALAGALGVRLGGPSSYFGRLVEKPYIGDPGPPLTAAHYRQTLRLLYGVSGAMAFITFLLLWAAGAGVWGVILVLWQVLP